MHSAACGCGHRRGARRGYGSQHQRADPQRCKKLPDDQNPHRPNLPNRGRLSNAGAAPRSIFDDRLAGRRHRARLLLRSRFAPARGEQLVEIGDRARQAVLAAPMRGCQPSTARACEMSGQRWTGSSTGSGRRTIVERDPVSVDDQLGELGDRGFDRVAEVDRPGDVVRRRPSAAESPRSGRRHSRRRGSGCRRRRA